MSSFEGKSIVVTGAGSGIGRETAVALSKAGARVTVTDISAAGAEETMSMIREAGGTARIQLANIAEEQAVRALIDGAVSAYGGLDGAFNNAGVAMHWKPITELTGAEWQRVIDINLSSVFYCLKYEMKAMMSQGRGGSIVNTSSGNGIVGGPNMAEFVASKFGVVGITKAAAIDGGPHQIRVNAICPGIIVTPPVEHLLAHDEQFQAIAPMLKRRHVIGRFGQPEDVSQAVMWLLSDVAAFITGVSLPVDGGCLAM